MAEVEVQPATRFEDTVPGTTPPAPPRAWVRRRQILLDRRYQLPGSVLTVGVAVVLLVLLNLGAHFLCDVGREALAQIAPQMETQLRHDDHVKQALLAAFSVLFIVCTSLITIVASHRTAGPVQRVRDQMRLVEQGHYNAAVKLRLLDNHQELALSFNSMLLALQSRVGGDVAQLETIASAVRTLHPESQAEELAAQIERLAREKHQEFSS